MSALQALLDIAGPPLGFEVQAEGLSADDAPGLPGAVVELLIRRNGFLALESALLVRPLGTPMDVGVWNAPDGWRAGYGSLADGLFCFAENALGDQFALDGDQVVRMAAESGERESVANSIEGWAQAILEDGDHLTGEPLVHDWQQVHGRLSLRTRLLAKQPFIAGGAFEVDNLVEVTDAERMRLGGVLATHVRELADGERFTLPYEVPEPHHG